MQRAHADNGKDSVTHIPDPAAFLPVVLPMTSRQHNNAFCKTGLLQIAIVAIEGKGERLYLPGQHQSGM